VSKLDRLSQLAQATPTAKPVARDVVKSMPIAEPEPVKPEAKPTAEKPAHKATFKTETRAEKAEPELLAMPPSRDAEPRVQVLFRPAIDLNERLKRFCDDNHASIQDTLTLALEEFLGRRGA
jgi:hypothetical protein